MSSEILEMDVGEAARTCDEFLTAGQQYMTFAETLDHTQREITAKNFGPFADELSQAVLSASKHAKSTAIYCKAFAKAIDIGLNAMLMTDQQAATVMAGLSASARSGDANLQTTEATPQTALAALSPMQFAEIVNQHLGNKNHLSVERAAQLLPHVREAMNEFKITDPQSQAYFLAQTALESGGFSSFREHGTVEYFKEHYATKPNIMGNATNGIPQFIGRGAIQLTGEDNYRMCGNALGLDLVNQPELAEQDKHAFRVAAEYWTRSRGQHNTSHATSIDTIATEGQGDVYDEVSLKINPGLAHKDPALKAEKLLHRRKYLDGFVKAFQSSPDKFD